jgi:cytidine deaminase
MGINRIEILWTEYSGEAELCTSDRALLLRCRLVANWAYAPYSRFKVGCVLLLADGSTVEGNNQENAAFPSGLCAERVALFAAGANRPEVEIVTAVICHSGAEGQSGLFTPCGACRQVFSESEHRQSKPIRMLLEQFDGRLFEFRASTELLPLSFSAILGEGQD